MKRMARAGRLRLGGALRAPWIPTGFPDCQLGLLAWVHATGSSRVESCCRRVPGAAVRRFATRPREVSAGRAFVARPDFFRHVAGR